MFGRGNRDSSPQPVVEGLPGPALRRSNPSVDIVFPGDNFDRYVLSSRYGTWGDLSKSAMQTLVEVHGPIRRTEDGRVERPERQHHIGEKAEVRLLGVRTSEEIAEIGGEIAQVLRNHREGTKE